MSKLLKSKYNNSGDRCVDACLSYGELRYLDHEGQPINIEVPEDKYEEAIIDFTERKKEGLVSSSIDPIKVLKKGSFTYNQVKNIANLNKMQEMEVANRSEIKTGKAEIMCELENGKIETYKIEIQKIFIENNEDNKSMLIKITDDKLIEKTGGIIQGMSGAPIIQNGKFIGAVTHVLVNDSKMGYGIFGDLMIKQMREVT